MLICINQRTTPLISLYESTTLLLFAKQNFFNYLMMKSLNSFLFFSPNRTSELAAKGMVGSTAAAAGTTNHHHLTLVGWHRRRRVRPAPVSDASKPSNFGCERNNYVIRRRVDWFSLYYIQYQLFLLLNHFLKFFHPYLYLFYFLDYFLFICCCFLLVFFFFLNFYH